jgi:hypothetical protein
MGTKQELISILTPLLLENSPMPEALADPPNRMRKNSLFRPDLG